MAAISNDLRLRIFEARQAGETTAEVAERFAVSPAFVRRLLQRHRETGSLTPPGGRRGPQPLLAAQADRIRQLVAEHPDLTAGEVRERLGTSVSVLTVWRMLRRLGLTFKKSRSTPPNSSDRTSRKPGRRGRKSLPTPRQNASSSSTKSASPRR
jgi:transposase